VATESCPRSVLYLRWCSKPHLFRERHRVGLRFVNPRFTTPLLHHQVRGSPLAKGSAGLKWGFGSKLRGAEEQPPTFRGVVPQQTSQSPDPPPLRSSHPGACPQRLRTPPSIPPTIQRLWGPARIPHSPRQIAPSFLGSAGAPVSLANDHWAAPEANPASSYTLSASQSQSLIGRFRVPFGPAK